MKASERIFFLPAFFLLISYFMKLASIPNQVLLVGIAFVTILILLRIFLNRETDRAKSVGQKFAHIIFFLLNMFVMTLPFANMFNQGLFPLIIYSIMVISVILYFIKINKNKYTVSNFIYPNNYRNFVLLNYVLIILNSPFVNVLPDNYYMPQFQEKYELGKGPVIYIDETHNNWHTASGLYTTFANILKKDGYNIKPFTDKFTIQTLQKVKILVISNALNTKNIDNWEQPVLPAYDDSEIQNINTWVNNGGSLFLIADHMPFSSASKSLASTFGFTFSDGFAKDKLRGNSDLFSRQKNMLLDNEITKGSNPSEYIDSIVTFTGQAFNIPDSAKSILNFNDDYVQYSPQVAWEFKNCKPENITGFSQGAFMNYGKGRIVIFGEAAMFSGQLGAGLSWVKIGLNSSKAKNNYKLLLNIVHWLDNKKPKS
jgi:hypothetical protein